MQRNMETYFWQNIPVHDYPSNIFLGETIFLVWNILSKKKTNKKDAYLGVLQGRITHFDVRTYPLKSKINFTIFTLKRWTSIVQIWLSWHNNTYCHGNQRCDILLQQRPTVTQISISNDRIFRVMPRVSIPRSVWGLQVLMSVSNGVMRKYQKFSQVYEFIFAVSICQKSLNWDGIGLLVRCSVRF